MVNYSRSCSPRLPFPAIQSPIRHTLVHHYCVGCGRQVQARKARRPTVRETEYWTRQHGGRIQEGRDTICGRCHDLAYGVCSLASTPTTAQVQAHTKHDRKQAKRHDTDVDGTLHARSGVFSVGLTCCVGTKACLCRWCAVCAVPIPVCVNV